MMTNDEHTLPTGRARFYCSPTTVYLVHQFDPPEVEFRAVAVHTGISSLRAEKLSMAAAAAADDAHQKLLDSLDMNLKPCLFRNPNYKTNPRRNKTVAQMLAEEAREKASALATQNNSGTATPSLQSTNGHGIAISDPTNGLLQAPSITEATQSLSRPSFSYMGNRAAPSIYTAQQGKYSDITGRPSKYRDPKTGLRYANMEEYKHIQTLAPGQPEKLLELRNAHTVLK